jgi:hypothetical protein
MTEVLVVTIPRSDPRVGFEMADAGQDGNTASLKVRALYRPRNLPPCSLSPPLPSNP